MNKNDLLRELGEIMQLEHGLTGDELLNSIDEWDSLAILSLMSVFDLKAQDLRSAKTVGDLIDLMEARRLES